MSRFGESVVDLLWAAGEGFFDRLKALSSSMVEDDEYVLIFVLFLGVPTVIVMALIALAIRRTHDRVRYATEYEEQNPNAFVTSSSSASDSSISGDDDDNNKNNNNHRLKQYTMEEIYSVSQKLTEQETLQRRAARKAETAAANAAAAAAAGRVDTAEVASRDAMGVSSTSSEASAPAASAEVSDEKND